MRFHSTLQLGAVLFACLGLNGCGRPSVTTTTPPTATTTPVLTTTPGPQQREIHRILENVSALVSKKFNCSISLAFKSDKFEVSAANGIIDFSTGRQADIADKYVWGSGTKAFTAASILKLVSEGAFSLDDRLHTQLDPMLATWAKANPAQGFSSLAELWTSRHVKNITVKDLLHMETAVPDFDTATPCFAWQGPTCRAKDSLRAMVYKTPGQLDGPLELMNLDWVRGQWSEPRKGTRYRYSSTNYMLLGLLLAKHTGATSWQAMDQGSFLPRHMQGELEFATEGPPSRYTGVHGYDRTAYNVPKGTLNDIDVHDVASVFSGWTASNMIGTVSSAARLAWDIYRAKSIAPPGYAELMSNQTDNGEYGLGTQLFRNHSGQPGLYGEEYGHSGATYGYQSAMFYYPELDFVLAVASNIEMDHHYQAKTAMCYAYNEVAASLLNRPMRCKQFKTKCRCTSLIVSSEASSNPSFSAPSVEALLQAGEVFV